MAEVLQFRPAAKRKCLPGRLRGGSVVVLFPGVRYERDTADEASGDADHSGAAHPAQKNS